MQTGKAHQFENLLLHGCIFLTWFQSNCNRDHLQISTRQPKTWISRLSYFHTYCDFWINTSSLYFQRMSNASVHQQYRDMPDNRVIKLSTSKHNSNKHSMSVFKHSTLKFRDHPLAAAQCIVIGFVCACGCGWVGVLVVGGSVTTITRNCMHPLHRSSPNWVCR